MSTLLSPDQIEKANAFHALHVRGNPLVLYNIWDAGGAKAMQEHGDKAIATGSWSVAAAHGYADGELMPLDLLLMIAARITASVSLPVSIDFEGAYARDAQEVGANATRLIKTGAIGCNFEDQIIAGEGLYAIKDQVERIQAMRQASDLLGIPFFINARTDLFLKEPDQSKHAALMAETTERAAAYREAGADGFFVPGLVNNDLIERICETASVPVNILKKPGVAPVAELASLGVSRISYGPGPYRQSLADLNSARQGAIEQ